MNSGLNQLNINSECCYELNKNIWFNRSFHACRFFMEANRSKIFKIRVLHFPSCVCLLQSECLTISKCFKYDYCVSGSVGLWSVGPWVGGFNKTLL